MFADLVDLDDVRMLQRRHGLRFDEKAGQGIGAGVPSGEHHLEGDEPVELLLPRLVDDPHAAAAKLAENLIAADMGHRPPGRGIDRRADRIRRRRREGDARVAARRLPRPECDGAVVWRSLGRREDHRRSAVGARGVEGRRQLDRGVVGDRWSGGELDRGIAAGGGREVHRCVAAARWRGELDRRVATGWELNRGVASGRCRRKVDGGVASRGGRSGLAVTVVRSVHRHSSNVQAVMAFRARPAHHGPQNAKQP